MDYQCIREAEAARSGKMFRNMVFHCVCNETNKEVHLGLGDHQSREAVLPNCRRPICPGHVAMTAVESGECSAITPVCIGYRIEPVGQFQIPG